jgi:hypothetical protein
MMMGRISTFFFLAASRGIGQRSEKCDWPRREQVSFVVQERFARVWSSTPVSTLLEFQSSSIPVLPFLSFLSSEESSLLHGSYCLLVMSARLPRRQTVLLCCCYTTTASPRLRVEIARRSALGNSTLQRFQVRHATASSLAQQQ